MSVDCSFPVAGCLDSIYYYCFTEIPAFNANNIDADQTPHSDLSQDLH